MLKGPSKKLLREETKYVTLITNNTVPNIDLEIFGMSLLQDAGYKNNLINGS